MGGEFVGQQGVQFQTVGSPSGQVIEITPPQMASPTSAAASKGASAVQVVNGPVQSYSNSSVNPLLQMSPQMIATPVAGPGGTIAYNIIPQYQTVVVIGADGQEQTVVVPTGSVPQQAQSSAAATSTPRQVVQVSQSPVRVQTPASSSTAVAQSVSLSGGTVTVNNLAQSGVVNVGGTPQTQTSVVAKQSNVVQNVSTPVQQMMSVQIPVTNASGQTVYQTIQVPLPSQTAAAATPAPLTMYNLFPQQTITLSTPATSGACDAPTSGGAGQMIAAADGSVKFITMPSPQQQTQQVFTVPPGAVASNGSVGNSPVAMLMAVPQQAASVQQAGGIVQTPSGGGTVLLSNGQVLQTVGGNVCQNIQVVGQPGQLLQGQWAGQTTGSVQLQVRIALYKSMCLIFKMKILCMQFGGSRGISILQVKEYWVNIHGGCKPITVRLKVEIHEIQFSEVTNYRNPRNPPPISRNPHARKRNPTPATKSMQHPQKLIIEIHQRWTVVTNTWL